MRGIREPAPGPGIGVGLGVTGTAVAVAVGVGTDVGVDTAVAVAGTYVNSGVASWQATAATEEAPMARANKVEHICRKFRDRSLLTT